MPLQDLLQGAIEQLAVRGRDVQAKGIEAGWHHLAPNLDARAAEKVGEDLAVAVLDSPDGHGACSEKAARWAACRHENAPSPFVWSIRRGMSRPFCAPVMMRERV
jgi:hypothetical protein